MPGVFERRLRNIESILEYAAGIIAAGNMATAQSGRTADTIENSNQ